MLAAGDVDADDGDVGGPPPPRRRRARATGSRASASTTASASAAVVQRSPLALDGHDADGARGAGAPGGRERQRAALAGAADDGDHGRPALADVPRDDPGGQRRGAADVHHREGELGRQVAGQPRRRSDRPKRIAWPSHGTCSLRPSQRARPS